LAPDAAIRSLNGDPESRRRIALLVAAGIGKIDPFEPGRWFDG